MKLPLAPLRRRLALWYAGTIAASLLGFGALLYVRLTHEFEQEFLQELGDEAEEAAVIMQMHAADGLGEGEAARRTLSDVHRRDRPIYIFRDDGEVLGLAPDAVVDPRVLSAARTFLGGGGPHETSFQGDNGQHWHATGRSAVVGGDTLEFLVLADRATTEGVQERLLAAFVIAGVLATALIVVGGLLLVHVSMRPVSDLFEYRERFLGDLAHELRTPLAVMHTTLEAANSRARDAERDSRAFRDANRETRRMSRMVNDLLLLARAESGSRPLRLESCYLDDVVSDVVNSAGPLAAERGVRLDLHRFDEAPVRGDADLLVQLVRALIDNALKFTPSGGVVRVGVGMTEGFAEVTVEDTGPGIDKIDLPHIFDRSYRSKRSWADVEGSGLGLAVARWIMQAHGGNIRADNVAGGGARFTARLPARAPIRPVRPARPTIAPEPATPGASS